MPGSPEMAALQDARAGNLHAFEQLVRQHQAEVHGLALQLTGEPYAASELAQDAFVRLHNALPRIASPEHLEHWLLRTVSQRAGSPALLNPEELLQQASSHRDPGADFTMRVMARVQLRHSHRRTDLAAGAMPGAARWRKPAALLSAAIILGIAALLTLWPSGTLRKTATTAATGIESTANGNASEAVITSTTEDSRRPAAAHAGPAAQDIYPYYTLIVPPLERSTSDPESFAAMDAFRTTLLAELRKVPDIEVLIPGVTAPPDMQQPADYLLTVSGLDAKTLPSGNMALHMTESRNGTALPAALTAEGQVRSLHRQWPVQLSLQPLSPSQSASFTSTLQLGRDSNQLTQLAAAQVEMLRVRAFPDVQMKQQLAGRLLDRTLNTAARDQALLDLLGTQRARGQTLEASDVRAIVQHAVSMNPDQRAQLWRSLRGNAYPDLLQPLIDYMRNDPDATVQYEAMATLAADYGADARARSAIESLSRDDRDQVLRMAAQRALHGDAEWRAYVIATLKNTGLPYPERLSPLLRAGRSASTPAETLAMRTLLTDEEIGSLLSGAIHDNWFDFTQTPMTSQALNLLASFSNATAFDLFVEIPQDAESGSAAAAAAPENAATPRDSAASAFPPRNPARSPRPCCVRRPDLPRPPPARRSP